MSVNFSRSLAVVVLAVAMALSRSGAAAEIPWSTDIEDSLHRADSNSQLVFMEFTADWCVFCKKMEKNTFTNDEVTQRISSNFVAVKVDADQNKDLVKDLGIKGLPAILIVSPDLKVIERISGFQTPEALITKLDAITAAHPNRGKHNALVSSGNSPQRSMNRPSQPEQFEPDAVASSRPATKELEFEAITQDEAPRVGNRQTANPSKRPLIDDASGQQPKPAITETVSADSESFFKTISREQESGEEAPEKSGPAFNGLCIVSAVEGRELVNGTADNQINYRGHTLYFSSTENKERFISEPDAFWPVLDGICAMTLLADERRVEGSLEFAAVFRKRIWLFTSQEAMREFLHDPVDIAEEATEVVAELER